MSQEEVASERHESRLLARENAQVSEWPACILVGAFVAIANVIDAM